MTCKKFLSLLLYCLNQHQSPWESLHNALLGKEKELLCPILSHTYTSCSTTAHVHGQTNNKQTPVIARQNTQTRPESEARCDSLTSKLGFIVFKKALLELEPSHFILLTKVSVPEGVDSELLTTDVSDGGLSSKLGVETTTSTNDCLRSINSCLSGCGRHSL